jgi:hypothetical protein
MLPTSRQVGMWDTDTRFDVDLAQAVRLTFEPLDSWSHSTDRAAHGAAGEVR